jgi:FKBP-type peptidyl-prolyl cis-trans isomerase
VEEENQDNVSQSKIMIVLGIIAFGAFALIFFGNFGAPKKLDEEVGGIKTEQEEPQIGFEEIEQIDEMMTVEKLQIEDIIIGEGKEATTGAKITVNYAGTLTDGTKFDSSFDRDEPFTFVFGVGQVIPGWDEGLVGMKVGGKRKLTIPSDMAYGEAGAGDVIPPNSTLIFEVELLEVELPEIEQ